MLPRLFLYTLAWVVPLTLAAQTLHPFKKRPEPTGLKILSTTIDRDRNIVVKVQNTTDKTVDAYVISYKELDKNGLPITPYGSGMAVDLAYPNHTPREFGPGQIITIENRATKEAASVEVTFTGVVYSDLTARGETADLIFSRRYEDGQERRRQSANAEGEKKAELERQAEWYEVHSKEVEK